MSISIEELKEFMQEESNKEVFDELAKAAGYQTKEDVQGLKNKTYELLGKIKKAKEEREQIQKQLDSYDHAGYTEYKEKTSKNEPEKPNRDVLRLQEKLKEFETNNQRLETELNRNLINSSLSKIFDEVGIDSKHKSLLSSAFSGKAKVEKDGDRREIVIDDSGLGLPAEEYFSKWVEGDQGREYLKKPDNSGASSRAFNQGGSKTIKKAEFDKLPPQEKMTTAKSHTIVD